MLRAEFVPGGRLRALFHFLYLGVVALMFQSFSADAAPASTQRLVLAFGDSLTAGYRLKPNESFPAQLEAALKAEGRNVRVHNAGVSGDTTAGGKARLAWVLNGLKQKPDLAILELGANDMLRGFDPKVTRANLDAMMAEFRKRGIPVVIAGMFSSPNLGMRYFDEFNAIYPELARKYDATLYPFFLKGVAFNRPLLLEDGIHPNKQGVALITKNILPTVRKALDGLPRPARAPGVSVPARAAN
jgi:acyl-CoA thioesterase-1